MSLYSRLNFKCWGSVPESINTYIRNFDTYGIQYNHSGTVVLSVDDEEVQQFDGSCFFISKPGYKLTYRTLLQQTRHHNFVTFTGERVSDYIEAGIIDALPPKIVKVHNPIVFLQIMKDLHFELSKNSESLIAVNLLDRLLLLTQEEQSYSKSFYSIYTHAFNNLYKAIISNSLKNWDFKHEAQKIGISYPHFRRIFKSNFNTSPNQFLLQCRFRYAIELLKESDMQIQEIAEKVGFSDVFFFSKQFKRHYGVSPLNFRKSP